MATKRNQAPAIGDLFAGIASAHAAAPVEPAPESHLAIAQSWLEEQESVRARLLETCDPAKRHRVVVEWEHHVRYAREFRDHVRDSQRADGSCDCRYCSQLNERKKNALFQQDYSVYLAEDDRLRLLSDSDARALAAQAAE